eukprot:2583620-Amphidinium_carterae.1
MPAHSFPSYGLTSGQAVNLLCPPVIDANHRVSGPLLNVDARYASFWGYYMRGGECKEITLRQE